MAHRRSLLELRETLTPADHQTHRDYAFEVPPAAERLTIEVAYTPKHLAAAESMTLAEQALRQQAVNLAERVGAPLAQLWANDQRARAESVRIANLVTIALDDARRTYRGAGHRHAPAQHFEISRNSATPGLVAGPLTPGAWRLTLSAHTLVSPQVEVVIQIGAEIASSWP